MFFVALAGIILTNNLTAQNLPNPTGGNNALTNLTCDFGPRNVAGASKFHKGLDYGVGGLYGSANAVEGGAIDLYRENDANNSYIGVGNFRYRHVHVGTIADANGNIIWDYRINSAPNYQLLIIREVRNGVLTTANVYVNGTYVDPQGKPSTTYNDLLTNMTVALRQIATQGDLIFKARAYPSGPHLHLERVNTRENPLSFMSRTNANDPTINLSLKHNSSNVATEFTGDIIYGNVIVETEENTDPACDFDNLQLQVNCNGQTVKSFSYSYTGANQMFYAAGANNRNGLSNIAEHNILFALTDEQEIREATGIGIYPIRHVQSHNFFKYGFNSEQTIATSTLARGFQYPDGQYTIRVIGTDVGTPARSTTRELIRIIDNLRPYIHSRQPKDI